jgi:dTDP-L-rhamnose 4-epimerase
MTMNILVTGGAGFIGSHLCDELLAAGYRVRVLDNLHPQVHGGRNEPPDYLDARVDFMRGDVCDRSDVEHALKGIEAVFHFAAAVGVGQSMYELAHYTRVNNLGTALLLELLIHRPVRKFIIASSMSIYGEGLYERPDGRREENASRTIDQLRQSEWAPLDSRGLPLKPLPTPESKSPELASIYALSKFDQERMSLLTGRAYGMPTAALRFFNVFGPRQALSNPYTGVLAIFASRLLNGKPPLVFEDGLQQRDFVSVHDIARACRLALETEEADGQVFNIGSGVRRTINDVAALLARVMEREDLAPKVTGKYRVGDIRHCFAEISRARQILGYEPQVSLEDGMGELVQWLRGQATEDHVEDAHAELSVRGLTL